MYQSKPRQCVEVYKTGWLGTCQDTFDKDCKKKLNEGWRLVSVQATGSALGITRILTAIYER